AGMHSGISSRSKGRTRYRIFVPLRGVRVAVPEQDVGVSELRLQGSLRRRYAERFVAVARSLDAGFGGGNRAQGEAARALGGRGPLVASGQRYVGASAGVG